MARWTGTALTVVSIGVTLLAGCLVPAASAHPGVDVAPAGGEPPGRPLSVHELDLGDGTAAASGWARTLWPDSAPEASGPSAPGAEAVDSGPRDTAVFFVMGVSWVGAADATVSYRTRAADGGWTAWGEAGEGEGESSGLRRNTDALAVGLSEGVQVVVHSPTGHVEDVKVVLIDPGDDPQPAVTSAAAGAAAPGAGVAAPGASVPTPDAALAAATTVARPGIITRAQWGADESLRTCAADYTTSLVSAAVHHTVSTNSYTAGEAAGVVRGIYAYHTRPEAAGGRGWCDVGYNALVDRFGRIYEGRAGSFDESVVGVHTGGFNARTFGVSVIGNYDTAVPPAAVLEGVSQAIAWKFATERILGNARVSMESGGGASKHPAGTVVTFPTIYGHRDAQLTACPGQQLYDRLQLIRDRVSALANDAVNASPMAIWESTSTDPSRVRVGGWAFDPESSASIVVDVVVDRVSHPVRADRSRPDVGAAYPAAGSAHGFEVSVPLGAGNHVVCIWARNLGSGNDQLLGCRRVSVVNAAPVGFVDQVTTTPSSVRLSGWALDADTAAAIPVHVYAGGVFLGATTADRPRPDVGAAYPGLGPAHGFSVEVPVAAGTHQICAYAINAPAGHNPAVGCRAVTVVNATPVGFLDQAAGGASSVSLSGWAADADTSSPITVHAYVGGRYAGAATASLSRPDVAAAGYGAARGYRFDVPAPPGANRVCLWAINVPAGYNPSLGCRDVVVR